MIPARMLIVGLIALGGLLLAGCQPKSATLTHVTGRVLYKGIPLHGGLVVFSPDTGRGESGKIGFSKIKEDGTYTLQTGDAPGAAPAGIASRSHRCPGRAPPTTASPTSLIPDKYRDPLLSQLQCE